MKRSTRAWLAVTATAGVASLTAALTLNAFASTSVPSVGSQFHTIALTRALDTRTGSGAVAANSTTVLDLSPLVPSDATAVAINLTVAAGTAGGYVEAYADGASQPLASTLNFAKSQSIANGAIVQLLDDKVDLLNASGGTVQLIVDVSGYFEPSGSANPSPSSASASPSASPSVSATSPATGSPTPSQPTDTPSATPSATPSTNPPPPGAYVQPGTVGYLGSTDALTVYKPGGPAPAGCSWQAYGLNCSNDSDTWDHVWIQSSVYWRGTGTLKVTNSIITGAPGSAGNWYALLGHTPANQAYPGATIDVEDSTIGYSGAVPGNVDSAPIWSAYGNQRLIAIRDDLSGMAQGIDPTDSSVIENNYIHGLVQNGTGGKTTHLDGIFSQGGGNILIQGNYVDAPVRSDTTAALFIQDLGSTDTGISIKGNYLNGGAYVLRNQTGLSVDVEGNTFGAGVWGLVGDLTGYPGTYGTWTGNVDASGAAVAKP